MVHKISLFLTAAALQRFFADAGPDEAESVLKEMESMARAVRDEMEIAYSARCDPATIADCENNNYNDCSSQFPHPQCRFNADDKSPPYECSCGLLWDPTISTATMPRTLLGENHIPKDDAVIESVCYSRLVEQYKVETYHHEFWDQHDVRPAVVLYGSNDGVFRRFPAKQHVEVCWVFDPRSRPWYAAASSPPKVVLLLMDLSSRITDEQFQIMKVTATTIIRTLTVFDRVSVITFSSSASDLLGRNTLVRAVDENRDRIVGAIDSLEQVNTTSSSLYNAFNITYDILSNSITENNSSIHTTSVILLTDGKVEDGQSEENTSKVVDLFQEQSQNLAEKHSKNMILFAYSVGDDTNTSFTKDLACRTGGVWKHLGDAESTSVISALSSYYKLFSTGIANGEHDDFVAWVEPFHYYHDDRMGTTVTAPVFNRNVFPYELVGVAGIGIFMDSIDHVFGSNATSWFHERLMKTSINESAINLTECQLEALRVLGGGEEATCGLCNNSSSIKSFLPEICNLTSLPSQLWHNYHNEEKSYVERACCEHDANVSSQSCLTSSEPTNSSNSAKKSWSLLVTVATTVPILSIFALRL